MPAKTNARFAVKTKAQFTVQHEITGDAVQDEEPWNVYAPNGDFEACFETEAEAVAHAVECNETLGDEAEEEERSELVDVLQERIADMDLKELRKLAKRLGL